MSELIWVVCPTHANEGDELDAEDGAAAFRSKQAAFNYVWGIASKSGFHRIVVGESLDAGGCVLAVDGHLSERGWEWGWRVVPVPLSD